MELDGPKYLHGKYHDLTQELDKQSAAARLDEVPQGERYISGRHQ